MGERVNFKAGVHCSNSSPRSITRPRLPRKARCWIPLSKARAIIEALGCGCSTMRRTYCMRLRTSVRAQTRPELQHALFLVWHAANHICAKRLIPFLPTLVEALERHKYLHLTEECRSQLLSMSAATADRLLRSQRSPTGGSWRNRAACDRVCGIVSLWDASSHDPGIS